MGASGVRCISVLALNSMFDIRPWVMAMTDRNVLSDIWCFEWRKEMERYRRGSVMIYDSHAVETLCATIMSQKGRREKIDINISSGNCIGSLGLRTDY